jgi:hypothetical protein
MDIVAVVYLFGYWCANFTLASFGTALAGWSEDGKPVDGSYSYAQIAADLALADLALTVERQTDVYAFVFGYQEGGNSPACGKEIQ